LYLVAVDLEAYSTQLVRAEAMPSKYGESAMNRFATLHIWRWLSMIIAHHPDAQFVFVGTKADRVENKERIEAVREDIYDRFEKWEKDRHNAAAMASWRQMKTERPRHDRSTG
jgi:hypothetical protein